MISEERFNDLIRSADIGALQHAYDNLAADRRDEDLQVHAAVKAARRIRTREAQAGRSNEAAQGVAARETGYLDLKRAVATRNAVRAQQMEAIRLRLAALRCPSPRGQTLDVELAPANPEPPTVTGVVLAFTGSHTEVADAIQAHVDEGFTPLWALPRSDAVIVYFLPPKTGGEDD